MKQLLQVYIALIPIVVSFSTTDPVLSIRFLALSILVSILLLIHLLAKKEFYTEVIRHPAMLSFLCLILVYTASSIYNGFDSESIFTVLKLFLLYVFTLVMTHVVMENGHKPLLNAFIMLSLLLSGVYFYQLYNKASANALETLASTMANKNLLSSLQFLIIPIALYQIQRGKLLFKIAAALALSFILFTLLQTQTRSALLALLLFGGSYLLLIQQGLRKKQWALLIMGFVLVVSASFGALKVTERYDSFEKEIRNTINIDFEKNPRARLYKSTFSLIEEHPWLGVGPGKWRAQIPKYEIYHHTSYSGYQFFQRPHNDFLWVFAEGGLMAGLSYLLLFFFLMKSAYNLHKNRKDKKDFFPALLFSTFLGYAFISFVDFPMERASHLTVFFTLSSFVIAAQVKLGKTPIASFYKYLFIVLSFCMVYVAYVRYQGEVVVTQALKHKAVGNWTQVISLINRAYHPNLYTLENSATPLLWYRGVAYFSTQRFDQAFKDFQQAHQQNPYHVHVLNNLATLYELKGDREQAKKYYRAVFEVNPRFMEARVNMAALLNNENNYAEALDVILLSHKNNKNKIFIERYYQYVNVIANSWIDTVYDDAHADEQKVLAAWRKKISRYGPKKSAAIIKRDLRYRQEEGVDYLTALMKVYAKK